MDDIINRRNKNQPDDLFQKLNSNHSNLKYTVEVKPEILLNTKFIVMMQLLLKLNVMKESYQSTGHQRC